jgi:hypothetical protein
MAKQRGAGRSRAAEPDSRDPARLGTCLEGFVGHPAYGTAQLRADLDRFVFLPGGSDGEPLPAGHGDSG